jgi:hypothetical protein
MANVAEFEHHELTFRMPTDAAACLRCRQLLTLDDLGTPCPGPSPERAPAATEPGNPA